MSIVENAACAEETQVRVRSGVEVIPSATANIGGIYLATGSLIVAGFATLVILAVVFRSHWSSGG